MQWLKMVEAFLELFKCMRKRFVSRTLLEQILMISSLLLFILFISMLLAFITRNSEGGTENDFACGADCLKHGGAEDETAMCTTVSCMKHANYILEKLEPSVEPCDDFYEFACGSYRRHHALSGRRRAHKVEDDVESILTSNVYHRSRSYRDAKVFYKCCMEGTDEFDGMSDLILQILKTSDIQWSSALSDRQWKRAVVSTILYDSFPFYYISLDFDEDTVTAKVSKAQRGTKRTLLSEEAYRYSTGEYRQVQMDYMDLIDNTMILTEKALKAERHENENCTNLHEIAVNLFKVEERLAKEELRCSRPKLLPGSVYSKRKLPSCSSMNDQTEWVAALVDEVIPVDALGHTLNVECNCINYVTEIEEDIKSNKSYRYYVLWRHLARYLPLVSSSFRHSYMRLYEALNPFEKDVARGTRYFSEKWKQCVHLTNKAYGLAIARMYKREGYQEDDDKEIIELTDNILKTYGDMFASQWFVDNETIYTYLEKLADLAIDVSYPEIISDEFQLYDFYLQDSDPYNYHCSPVRKVVLPKSCFVYSLLRNECVKTKNDLLKKAWYEKLNGSSFVDIPPISSRVNVDFERNTLTIPAGALRFPYYSQGFFKFAKYGGISTLVIRELSRRMRAELQEEDEKLDLIESSEKECLKDQYTDSWSDEKESQRNSERNWDEVIVDNVALKVAYELYKRDFEGEPDEPKLPNVEYNSDQLFFIKYAQMYCEIRNNTFSVFDKSIPAKFRVNNAMMNSKEFSDVFECPEESPMNPSDKCLIWS